METISISLGWNCDSAIYGVNNGIRKTKYNGYNTTPFDEMLSNYKGVIECIKDDFKYFCDINYLELIKIPNDSKYLNSFGDGDIIIYNSMFCLSYDFVLLIFVYIVLHAMIQSSSQTLIPTGQNS
jgi:hypothetical protein